MSNRIVCLDGYTLNPGDISWEPFEKLGELTVHDRTSGEETLARAAGAPCLLTNKTPLTAATMTRLPALKYVGVLATGFNIVDVSAATENAVVVTNVPTYGTDSVAQHVMALLLALVRPVETHDAAVKAGRWSTSPDWCFALTPIESLQDKTLGVVGVGRIGRAVARIGAALGMRVVGFDAHWPSEEQCDGLAIESLTLEALLSQADVVSLHCPLNDASHHLIDSARIQLMKPTAVLINTSRGPLVDEHALARALREGAIAGAGLDVLECEPPPPDNPLLTAPRCLITPHIAWYARSSRQRLMDVAADNLRAFLNGESVNRVQ